LFNKIQRWNAQYTHSVKPDKMQQNTGWSKKMAQSLWHHNFATIHHRVMRFSAKCSEKNSLHN